MPGSHFAGGLTLRCTREVPLKINTSRLDSFVFRRACWPSRGLPKMNFLRHQLRRFFLPLGLGLAGAALCFWLVPVEAAAVRTQLLGFPDSSQTAHNARPVILGCLCFLPALAALTYACGGTIDRYVTRQFSSILLISAGALVVIWLLMDLNNSLSEFLDGPHPLRTAARFYAVRSPAITLLLLPYALLLASLYCLGKFSSSREIVAIIQSGRSVLRLSVPLILAAFFCSLLCLGLNFHWAATGEGLKKEILSSAKGKIATRAKNVMYWNELHRRMWMVGTFSKNYENGSPLLDVVVRSTREDGTLEQSVASKNVTWDRHTKKWTFEKPEVSRIEAGQAPLLYRENSKLEMDWEETPWQLIKPGLAAEYLGVPDLESWLAANVSRHSTVNPAAYLTQWHYRWALPFSCLIIVLLATPLAVHFSRRASGGGIFLAVVLIGLMLLATNVSLAMGEASLIPAALAAWLPNLIFGLLGLYLFQRRIAGVQLYQKLLALVFPRAVRG